MRRQVEVAHRPKPRVAPRAQSDRHRGQTRTARRLLRWGVDSGHMAHASRNTDDRDAAKLLDMRRDRFNFGAKLRLYVAAVLVLDIDARHLPHLHATPVAGKRQSASAVSRGDSARRESVQSCAREPMPSLYSLQPAALRARRQHIPENVTDICKGLCPAQTRGVRAYVQSQRDGTKKALTLFHSAPNSHVISSTCLFMVSGKRRRIKTANEAVEAANRRKTYAPSSSCKMGKV